MVHQVALDLLIERYLRIDDSRLFRSAAEADDQAADRPGD